MSRIRIRHHVNPLRPCFDHVAAERITSPAPAASEAAADLTDGTRREVEVELGCADARFLFERARLDPALVCIGLEIREELIADVNQRAAEAGLPNVRALFSNVNTDLPTLFADASLDRVFVNFPDPWWKRRHHKRRVLTAELVADISRALKKGGTLYFQSDVFELALDAMAVIEDAEQFQNALTPWSFLVDNPYRAQSLREVKCLEKGMRIWRMSYLRR